MRRCWHCTLYCIPIPLPIPLASHALTASAEQWGPIPHRLGLKLAVWLSLAVCASSRCQPRTEPSPPHYRVVLRGDGGTRSCGWAFVPPGAFGAPPVPLSWGGARGVPQPSRVAMPSSSSRFAHAREPVPVAPGAGSAQPRAYSIHPQRRARGLCRTKGGDKGRGGVSVAGPRSNLPLRALRSPSYGFNRNPQPSRGYQDASSYALLSSRWGHSTRRDTGARSQ